MTGNDKNRASGDANRTGDEGQKKLTRRALVWGAPVIAAAIAVPAAAASAATITFTNDPYTTRTNC